ncbi:MAG: hypothetical protein DRN71_05530 [Candidatus Nanohalarchaeota archaeon]|nr:MAG: hypothetical protein DRN71_05530 [Candidatus Nanohaloarchaeota archaeon]
MMNFKGLVDSVVDIADLRIGLNRSTVGDAVEFSLYSMTAYFMPLLISQQIFLGAAVNSMLVCGALYVEGKKLIPLIVLPSIGVLSHGFLFGSLSVYLFYMLPIIWIGNAVFVFVIKAVYLKKKSHFVAGIACASVLKCLFLFGSAFALCSFGVVPQMFLVAFGVVQFATAFSAGMIVWPVNYLRIRFFG